MRSIVLFQLLISFGVTLTLMLTKNTKSFKKVALLMLF